MKQQSIEDFLDEDEKEELQKNALQAKVIRQLFDLLTNTYKPCTSAVNIVVSYISIALQFQWLILNTLK